MRLDAINMKKYFIITACFNCVLMVLYFIAIMVGIKGIKMDEGVITHSSLLLAISIVMFGFSAKKWESAPKKVRRSIRICIWSYCAILIPLLFVSEYIQPWPFAVLAQPIVIFALVAEVVLYDFIYLSKQGDDKINYDSAVYEIMAMGTLLLGYWLIWNTYWDTF